MRRAIPWLTGYLFVVLAISLARDAIIDKFHISDGFVLSPWKYGNTTNPLPMSLCHGFQLEEASIDEMQQAMQRGMLTAVSLLDCYIERALQTQPYLNAILELNPDARTIARHLDSERRKGHVRGPLHGIPFVVKDNIASKDKMQTTAGSFALVGSVVPRDAMVVAKMRTAGAVLMGKASLSEWADMRSSNYSEGYSARNGQCRSAYNLTVNPGGSSSGSAVGVAANVFPIALGTETDGSVINPAERNAIVGIKPTVGRTSRAGVIPESINQDSVGAFGKSVRDATYAFDAMWGVDQRDNYTLSQPDQPRGYTGLISNSSALADARFGVPWDTFWVLADPEQQAKLLTLVKLIESAGGTVINHTEITNFPLLVDPRGWNWKFGADRGFANESEFTVVAVDFYNGIAEYLSDLKKTSVRSLQDIVDFNFANDGSEGGLPYPSGVPAFYSGQDQFLESLATGGAQNETYWQALKFCQGTSRNGIDDALTLDGTAARQPLNGLLVPPDVAQTYQVAAQAGYPMLTLPAAVHSESSMPYGIALMQTAWREDELIRYGSAVEDLVQTRGRALGLGRTLPQWRGLLERNIPVLNV